MKALRNVAETRALPPARKLPAHEPLGRADVMPQIPEPVPRRSAGAHPDRRGLDPEEGLSSAVLFANGELYRGAASDNYKFVIFTCPVGPYYNEPVKL
jgi:hypothetical protein